MREKLLKNPPMTSPYLSVLEQKRGKVMPAYSQTAGEWVELGLRMRIFLRLTSVWHQSKNARARWCDLH